MSPITDTGAALLFIATTVAVRGVALGTWSPLNPDEAELMAQGLAAEHSFLPFTTWTMGTTGPIWPMFLAVLGHLGYPLTIASAHFLAAVLTGVVGFITWILMRRVHGGLVGLLVAVMVWLPLAMVFPVGAQTNFGALSTELLPCVLVLMAGLFGSESLASRPWLFAVAGLVSGLAVGAKYQVLPLVAALAIAQVIAAHAAWRRTLAAAAWWVGGAAAPYVILAIALVVSPSVSTDLMRQNLTFLTAYAGNVDAAARWANLLSLFSRQVYVVVILVLLLRLIALSSRRVALIRIGLALGGLAAVAVGGMAFPHYLWFLCISLALAAAQPTRQGTSLIPSMSNPRTRVLVTIVAAVGVATVATLGVASDRLVLSSPATARDGVRSDSVVQDSVVAAACPAGSDVLVWGWAAELYVYYTWDNAVPFMNTLGLRSTPENLAAARPLVAAGIDDADCVVDASGAPFFASDPAASLDLVYPEFVETLDRDFSRQPGVLDCDLCTLYVRD